MWIKHIGEFETLNFILRDYWIIHFSHKLQRNQLSHLIPHINDNILNPYPKLPIEYLQRDLHIPGEGYSYTKLGINPVWRYTGLND